MNPTNPYWQAPQLKLKGKMPIAHNIGFSFTLPWPDVVSPAGFYNGQGAMPGRKELVFRDDPEYFAIQGVVPSSGGIPRINPYDPIYKFDRSKFTVRY